MSEKKMQIHVSQKYLAENSNVPSNTDTKTPPEEEIPLPDWAQSVLGRETAKPAGSYPPSLQMEDEMIYVLTFLEDTPRALTIHDRPSAVITVRDPSHQEWSFWVTHYDLTLKIVQMGPLKGRTIQVSRRKQGRYWNYTIKEVSE